MVPDHWSGPEFPSLIMGDRHTPAKLYYWNASTGAAVLKSFGRATPQPVGQAVHHRARHTQARWTLILELPDLPAGYPIAFALWDGEFGDRDGLKFFSVWYVLLKD
jgi:DMSO reductase family type II enzyme heme b subunit